MPLPHMEGTYSVAIRLFVCLLPGVVFTVVHAPFGSVKSGMILDSLYRMHDPVLQAEPSGGQ